MFMKKLRLEDLQRSGNVSADIQALFPANDLNINEKQKIGKYPVPPLKYQGIAAGRKCEEFLDNVQLNPQ